MAERWRPPKWAPWAFFGGVAVFVLAACGRRGICAQNGKLCIEWHEQPDQDWRKLEAFMVACERTLGMQFTPYAEIIFVSHLQR